MTAGDIAGQFAIGNSSISHHLAILKTAELVQASRNGQTIVYSLNTTVFQEIMGWLLEFGEHEKTTN
jgi:DNA-binding transcriptional ArsR family regulator